MGKNLWVRNLHVLCILQIVGVQSSAVPGTVPTGPAATSIHRSSRSSSGKGFKFPSMPMSMLGFTINRLEKEEQESNQGTWIDVEYDTTDENMNMNSRNGRCTVDEDDDMFESTEDHYEIDDGYDDEDEEYDYTSSKRRNRKRNYVHQQESKVPSMTMEEEEHPMRTDEWLIKVNMSPFLIRSRKREVDLFPGGTGVSDTEFSASSSDPKQKVKGKKTEQLMKFARNGYVVLIEDGDDPSHSANEDTKDENNNNKSSSYSRVTKIGKWKVDTAGVSWHIPVRKISSPNSLSSSPSTTVLHYHADLILTKFQERPRMFRGVVCRDRYDDIHVNIPFLPFNVRLRKNYFRPVIATFTAEGIGVDTADTLYKSRGFGLSGSSSPTASSSSQKQSN